MMNTVNHDLLLVADKALEKLKSMSDEELLSTLENCEDNSISYAIDYDNFDFFRHEKTNRSSLGSFDNASHGADTLFGGQTDGKIFGQLVSE